MRYIKETKEDYLRIRKEFLEELKKHEAPYTISFKFIRNTNESLTTLILYKLCKTLWLSTSG